MCIRDRSDELRTTEEALSKTSELMAATVDYAKTRPVFDLSLIHI